MIDLADSCIGPDAPINRAIELIESNETKIALVVDEELHLLGTVTDGDIRRGLMRGLQLDRPVREIMNPHPVTASAGEDREDLLPLMRARGYHQLPLVDDSGRLVGIETLTELLNPPRRDNCVVLMAGGLGLRLRPLTETRPKPLLHVGPRPLLETVLQGFIAHGFHNFFISVSYRAEMVEEHFGTGERWGVTINYLREEVPLGTAGALSLLPSPPTSPVLVMNADLLTKLNFANLLDFHSSHAAGATMCVREHSFQLPYGLVELDGNRVLRIAEKPLYKDFVNAGVYVLEPRILSRISAGAVTQMTDLLAGAIGDGELVIGFPVREYWMDIGRDTDLQQAVLDFERDFRVASD